MTELDPLTLLCARLGVQRAYTDGLGQQRQASDDALLAILAALGHELRSPDDAQQTLNRLDAEDERRPIQPVTVLWQGLDQAIPLRSSALGHGAVEIHIEFEDGSSQNVPFNSASAQPIDERHACLSLDASTPVGFHTLNVSANGQTHTSRLFVAPQRCFTPERTATDTALFLPLYALRTERNLGVGTFAELGVLQHFARERNAAYIGTLPLLSTFLDDPFEPSPYAPVSRSVFGELFLDPHAAAQQNELPTLRSLLSDTNFAQAAADSRAHNLVSYREAWALVRRCLEAAATDTRSNDRLRSEIERFAETDPLIASYADFRATLLKRRRHHNTTPENERWLFLTAQWLLATQLDSLARGKGRKPGGLYLDLPVGAIGSGFDAHRRPELYAQTVSLGAPPDALFRKGQTWGFPPQIPSVSRDLGHAEFIECVDRHGRAADALRIDHAAGLHRCFWVPRGFDATDGVYVHSPREELFAVLTILSHRRHARVIGENLGTIPHEVNESMAAHNVLGMRIAQFELGDEHHPLPTRSAQSLVALNTHDMPTFHAFWTGSDIDLNTRLGVFSLDQADAERESREAKRDRIRQALLDGGPITPDADDLGAILHAILFDLARKAPDVLAINLEDLWLEPDPQNIPGTVAEYPNWRRKAARSLDEITSDTALSAVIDRLVNETRTTDD